MTKRTDTPADTACVSCGMSAKECDAIAEKNRYKPAEEQVCCIHCAYGYTHMGTRED